MKFWAALIICFLSSGCLKLPFTGSGQKAVVSQPDSVERSIGVASNDLFKAAVREFRNIDIIESDEDSLYIKGIDGATIIEFKAEPAGRKASIFRVKAASTDGKADYKAARIFAGRIYKRAKSLWFSFVGHKAED